MSPQLCYNFGSEAIEFTFFFLVLKFPVCCISSTLRVFHHWITLILKSDESKVVFLSLFNYLNVTLFGS